MDSAAPVRISVGSFLERNRGAYTSPRSFGRPVLAFSQPKTEPYEGSVLSILDPRTSLTEFSESLRSGTSFAPKQLKCVSL